MSYFYGDARTYRAELYDLSAPTPALAVSNDVIVSPRPFVVSLQASKPVVRPDESATLTVHSNMSLGTGWGFAVEVQRADNGAVVGTCTGLSSSNGEYICSMKTQVTASSLDAGYVAILKRTVAGDVTEITRSNTVNVLGTAWNVRLVSSVSSVKTGGKYTLTAYANGNVLTSTTGKALYVIDQTTGAPVLTCGSSSMHYESPAEYSCGATILADQELREHNYLAVIAPPGMIADGAVASSNVVTVARAPWTFTWTATQANTRHVGTVEFQANQSTYPTGGVYEVFIEDVFDTMIGTGDSYTLPTGQITPPHGLRQRCTGNAYDGGRVTCTTHFAFAEIPDTGTHYVRAYVARADDPTGVRVGQSSLVQVFREKAWASLEISMGTFSKRRCTGLFDQEHNWYGEVISPGSSVAYITTNQTLRKLLYDTGSYQTDFWDLSGEAQISGPCASVKTYQAQIEATYTSPRTGRSYTEIVAESNQLVVPGDIWWFGSLGGANSAQYCADACAADPVNTSTGEFFATETDLTLPGFGPPVAISRTYSSLLGNEDHGLGHGWTPSFDMRIEPFDSPDLPTAKVVLVVQETGARSFFFRGTDGKWTAPERVTAVLEQDSNGFSFHRKDHLTFRFSLSGNLARVTDQNGNTTSIARDGEGRVSKISGGAGRWIELERDAAGRVVGGSDSDGYSVAYDYDAAGNLTGVNRTVGGVSTYSYDSAHHMTTFDLPGVGTSSNTFDTYGRTLAQTAPDGGKTTFSYGASSTTTTAPDGTATRDMYSGGKLVQRTEANGTAEAASATYTYTARGQVATVTDAMGRKTQYVYNADGDLAQTVDAAGGTRTLVRDADGNILVATNALGAAYTFTYDERGNLVSSTDALGNETTMQVGSRGEVLAVTDPQGGVTRYEYDARGNVTTVTSPEGVKSRTEFDERGRPTATYDPRAWLEGSNLLDYKTSFTYDAGGLLSSTTDPLGFQTEYLYDSEERMVSQADSAGGSTHYAYDSMGRVISETDALSRTYRYEYNKVGRRTAVVSPSGARSLSTYDRTGDLLTTKDPLGHGFAYTYNLAGQLLTATDADGRTTSYVYDAAGRNTKVIDPLGNASTASYDALGRLTQQVDPLGRETTVQYDALSRPVLVTYADNSRASFTYDANGNSTGGEDRSDRHFAYEYDLDGRVVSYTDVLARTTHSVYDAAGLLVSATQFDGQTSTITYDAAGRVTSEFLDGELVGESDYDDAGRLASFTDGGGTTTYSYDAIGRVTGVAGPTGDVGYAYTLDGERASLTYPSGRVVSTSFDSAGSAVGTTASGVGTWDIAHTPAGFVSSVAAPNGLATTYGYDGDGRLSGISVAGGGDPMLSLTYVYDAASQLTGRSTSRSGDAAESETFDFDEVGRVTSTGSQTAPLLYTDAHEPLTLPDGTTITVSGTGAAETASSVDGTTTYEYDVRGRRTGEHGGDSDRSFTWNNRDQVVSVQDSASSTDYEYSLGLRVGAEQAGSTAKSFSYVWDTTASVPQLLSDGEFDYIYAGGTAPIAQVRLDSGEVTYLHGDLIGSTRLATDASGEPVAEYDFDLDGKTQVVAGDTAATRFQFAGEYLDPTGDYYLRNRVYDPQSAQFLSVDPALATTGMAYAYTPGNPLQFVDPLGLYGNATQAGLNCEANASLWDAFKDELTSPAFWVSTATFLGCTAVTAGSALLCGVLAGTVHSAMAFEALPEEQQTLSNFTRQVATDVGLGIVMSGAARVVSVGVGALARAVAPAVSRAGGAFARAVSASVQRLEARAGSLASDSGHITWGGGGAANTGPRVWTNLAPKDPLFPGRTVPLDRLSSVNGRFQYVVGQDGGLIVGRGGHIDLARGSGVTAAGEVRVVNGEVRMFNNASGHYQPDASIQGIAQTAFENAGLTIRNGAWQAVTH